MQEREGLLSGMTSVVDDAILQRMTGAIVEVADPERVILLGSRARARGDAGADSDVDLVVVEAEPFGPGRDRGAEETPLWRALAKFHLPKDILVDSLDEADRWRGSLNLVLARALRQGGCSISDLEQALELFRATERDISALRGMGDAVVFADETLGSVSSRRRRNCSRLRSPQRARPTRCRTIWWLCWTC